MTPSEAETAERRQKAIYVGAPGCFKLEEAIRQVCDAFGVFCCYLVGSALTRQDWRDVDVRLILDDADFAREFPSTRGGQWEHDPRWLLFTTAISDRLSAITGLPIDFQIQPQTRANEMHKGPRSAIGLRFTAPDALALPGSTEKT